MRATDIAAKNRVSVEDILGVCGELGIACENGETDLSDKDVFLIDKKIEVMKEKKAKETRMLLEKKAEAGRGKIKLKRRVHASKDIIKPGEEKPEAEKTAASAEKEKPAPEKKPPLRERPVPGRTQDQSRAARTGTGRSMPPRPGDRTAQRPPRPGERPRTGPGPGAGKGEAGAVPKDDTKRKKKDNKAKEKDKEDKKRYNKQDEEKNIFYRKKKANQQDTRAKEVAPPKDIEITESILVGDLAKKLNIKANEIIAKLMQLGVMATINQVIDAETAQILAGEYGTEVKVVSLFDETVIKHEEEDREEDRVTRPPIVTVMGHVDHGKTKLLDAIRHTNVIDQEFGGITQHIGAYTVKVREKAVTFLDTPGHEAFTTMRARGASITDIVILVVAANDGIMPQTVEALNHAKDANVPIIVAINKIDLPEANPQKVRQELTTYGLIAEEWGGTTLIVNISAKQKMGIEDLLEIVLIQAEMLELKANNTLMARGTVIESKIDPGRGPVATILVQNGVLRVGDPYVVGIYSGRVRAIFNDHGENIQEAGPSTPVEVLGLAGVPSAGDPFQVVENEKYAKLIAQKRQELKRIETAKKVRKVTLEDLNEMIKDGEVQELKVIIKGDVDGSVQALKESLEKLSTGEIRVKVVHSGTGGINESDVMLASASNAIIIGYHVRPNARVSEVAEREKVSIKFYNIIYDVTNDVKAAMEGLLAPEIKEVVTGSGEIKQVFKISKVGTVAGSVVLNGKIERKNRLRLIRDGVVVFDGPLTSLKRFKDDASEVVAGQECGFGLENFNDIKEGDNFEGYNVVKISRKLE